MVGKAGGAMIFHMISHLTSQILYMVMMADDSHSRKYALECLYQLFLVKSLLAPRDSERFVSNRSVNTLGGKGKNIALDLDMETQQSVLETRHKEPGPQCDRKCCGSYLPCRSCNTTID
ncbi:hypothetical protein OS493_033083 [Desmophyllum pertusum]|uniref:Uncharacterized protein n=1 Tax=Desmophyllum pertusum TaxID=174260 RepID=A0A9W9Z8C1_9CNID|nr:hypothetical protein OS493_033083 [Desmophyllum pertusum]